MGSLFGSLEVGRKSLQAHQTALQVTSNNISNINTPGYSRQRALMQTSFPVQTAAGQIGTGVDVKSIESVRDRFLELRVSQGIQSSSAQEAIVSSLDQIQSVFGVGERGLQEGISAFFNAFSSLTSNPESTPLRNSVLSKASNLSALFQNSARQLADIQQNINVSIRDAVNQVNGLAASIAALNESIGTSEGTQTEASILRDQRSELLNKLSELVDVQFYEAEDGSFYVSVAGSQNLITANTFEPLQAVPTAPSGMVQVRIGNNDITSSIQGGKLAGSLDVRDRLLPSYSTDLDSLAQTIIDQVNTLHAAGTNLQPAPGNTGINLFNPTGPGTSAAATFSVNAAIVADVKNIAAGRPPFAGPPAGPGPGDNDTALKIADLIDQKLMNGGTETFAQANAALLFKIGTDAQTAERSKQTEDAVLLQLKNQRDSVSAVSLDEEAVDMIRFQRAYQAIARFMSTIDQLTGEIITNFGR